MFRALFIGEFVGKKLKVLNVFEPVYNGHPWDSKKWPLFLGGCYLGGSYQKLVLILD
jgi:hypothetical protein